MKAKRIKK